MTPKEKFVVLASDDNPDYSFYAPLTCAAWMKHGFHPILLLVGTSAQWRATPREQLVVDTARRYGAHVAFTGSYSANATATVAQLARIYGCAVPGVADDAYLLTSDVDMWPMGPWVGHQAYESGTVQLYNGAAYDQSTHPQYPMCYVGADAVTWRGLVVAERTLCDSLEYGLTAMRRKLATCPPAELKERTWDWDERYLGQLIARWELFVPGRKQVIPRNMAVYGQRRLDRSYWHVPPTLDGYADCHLPRPGFSKANWWSVRTVFEQLVGESVVREIDSYKAQWTEAR